MKALYFIFGILLGAIFGQYSHAYGVISCQYNYGISAFSTGNIKNLNRIQKKFELNGLKYTVYIHNTRKLTEVSDYIMIEDTKGHRITYAMECI